ncbi:MAG: hypothetical protein ACI8QD_001555 [Cyclobacteriaceae bacterium]|jgi:hypothetical protein
MENKRITSDLIDDFVAGRSSAGEDQRITELMSADKELASEVAFQKSIVSGLQSVRKQQLKARLASIPVSTSVWSTISYSSWFKPAITASLLSATAVVAYLYFDGSTQQPVALEEPVTQEMVTPQSRQEIVQIELPEKSIKEEIGSISEKPEIVPYPEEKPTIRDEFVPQVAMPDVDLNASEEVMQEEESYMSIGLSSVLSMDQPFNDYELEVISSADQPSYKYFDSKLILKGEFPEGKYDILEINQDDEKQLYLHTGSEFYLLGLNHEFQALSKINDQSLYEKLDSLLSNK